MIPSHLCEEIDRTLAPYATFLFHRVPHAVDTDGGFALRDRPTVIKDSQSKLLDEYRRIEMYLYLIADPANACSEQWMVQSAALRKLMSECLSQRSFDRTCGMGFSDLYSSVTAIRLEIERVIPRIKEITREVCRTTVRKLIASCQNDRVRDLLSQCNYIAFSEEGLF